MVTGQVMRTPVWGWSLPGPAATTSPSVGLSLDFLMCVCVAEEGREMWFRYIIVHIMRDKC